MGELVAATWNLYLGADLTLLLGELDEAELPPRIAEVRRQLGATAFPDRVDAIARAVVGLGAGGADVLGVQELCTWRLDGAVLWDGPALLCGALARAGAPYDVVVSQPGFSGAGRLDGSDLELAGSNAVLVRRDRGLEVLGTAAGAFGAALTLPALATGRVRIARGWCAVRLAVDGAEVTVLDTHTEAHDATSRDRQRDELLAVLPGGPLVVVGDLNATPDQVGMPPGLVDAWVAAGHAADDPRGATAIQDPDLGNAVSRLDHRIDYVFVRGVAVRGCATFGAEPADRTATGRWPSDHAGVVARLRVDQSAAGR